MTRLCMLRACCGRHVCTREMADGLAGGMRNLSSSSLQCGQILEGDRLERIDGHDVSRKGLPQGTTPPRSGYPTLPQGKRRWARPQAPLGPQRTWTHYWALGRTGDPPAHAGLPLGVTCWSSPARGQDAGSRIVEQV
jgi:hypothetical protein